MKFIRLSLLPFVFTLCLSGQAEAAGFSVKGRIRPTAADTGWSRTVYLSHMSTIDNLFGCDSRLIIDSARISKDGSFEFHDGKKIVDNDFYRLEVVHAGRRGGSLIVQGGTAENFAVFVLRKDARIEFTTELPHFNYALMPLRMDPINRAIRKLYDDDRPTAEATEELRDRRNKLEETEGASVDTIKNISWRIRTLSAAHNLAVAAVIDTLKPALLSLYEFMMHFPEDSATQWKMNNRYQREIPHSKYAGQLLDMLYDEYYSLPVGSQAPEFELPDTSGTMIALRQFRGKYVLVDFWASWCHPCRMENLQVVKPLVHDLAGKNFAVISISMDKDGALWKKAIQNDGLSWTELCDGRAFGSPAAIAYKVKDVPVTYVLSPDGAILSKNMRGKQLENFIHGLVH